MHFVLIKQADYICNQVDTKTVETPFTFFYGMQNEIQ